MPALRWRRLQALCELTPAQRAAAIHRRKEIWEAMRAAEVVGGKSFSTNDDCRIDGRKKGPQHEQQFASETAKTIGVTKQSLNQVVARAEALGDSIDEVVGTSLDKGVELDALKELPAQRAAAIHRRKEIWEAMHPETGGTNCPTSLADGRAAGPQHGQAFAADTAKASGESKRDINRAVARAEALGPDIHEVVGISLAYAITHPNILEFEKRKARERQIVAGTANVTGKLPSADGNLESGRVTEKLAEKAGVSARTVSRAMKVREKNL